jgi:hypothetical protein
MQSSVGSYSTDKIQNRLDISQKLKANKGYADTDIKRRRRLLQADVEEFNQQAIAFMGGEEDFNDSHATGNEDMDYEEVDEASSNDDYETKVSDEESEIDSDDDEGGEDEEEIMPEDMVLQMPSTITRAACIERGIESLMELEIQLREAQANDYLRSIREDLGYKSWLYKKKQANGRIGLAKLRSSDQITKSGQAVTMHVQGYKVAFNALRSLKATGNFRAIRKQDLALNKDVTEENRYNQSSHKLSWIWTTGTSENESPLFDSKLDLHLCISTRGLQ